MDEAVLHEEEIDHGQYRDEIVTLAIGQDAVKLI